MDKGFNPKNLDDWMNLLKTVGIVLTAIWSLFGGN